MIQNAGHKDYGSSKITTQIPKKRCVLCAPFVAFVTCIFREVRLCLVLLSLTLSGCLNLKHVNDYATNAVNGIKKFDEVDYSFEQHCMARCRNEAIDSFKLYRKIECPCGVYKRADSVVGVLGKTVSGYFDGLAKLSKNDLTSYRVDPLIKSLNEEDLEVFQLKKEEVDAYSKIANILQRSSLDSYRQRKIKEYIRDANPSVQIILMKLQFIESKNLNDLLEFNRERLFGQYRGLLKSHGLSDYEKQRAATEYYRALQDLEIGEAQIAVYSKSLKAIARGHQKLTENLDKISESDLQRSLFSFANEIRNLILEFNKLKHK